MAVNITNPPIDRRRLSREDRAMFNRSGGYAEAKKALARTRAYRGQQKYERNRPERTQIITPGTGGFTAGIGVQQARLREIGEERARAESFRPD
jgi:hypothetical protein